MSSVSSVSLSALISTVVAPCGTPTGELFASAAPFSVETSLFALFVFDVSDVAPVLLSKGTSYAPASLKILAKSVPFNG